MINVACFTNLDAYKPEKWPRQLACRPQVGDTVESDTGKRLKVIQIIHVNFYGIDDRRTPTATPILRVELNRLVG